MDRPSSDTSKFLKRVQAVAKRRILFLPHAIRQMSRPTRMIRPAEVRRVVSDGELIEDYPDDPRGHSCLILGYGRGGRPLHIVCCAGDDYLAIITAYLPSRREWTKGFKKRRV